MFIVVTVRQRVRLDTHLLGIVTPSFFLSTCTPSYLIYELLGCFVCPRPVDYGSASFPDFPGSVSLLYIVYDLPPEPEVPLCKLCCECSLKLTVEIMLIVIS